MQLRPAEADGAVDAGHVAAGGLHILPAGTGLLQPTGTAPEVIRVQHANDGLARSGPARIVEPRAPASPRSWLVGMLFPYCSPICRVNGLLCRAAD